MFIFLSFLCALCASVRYMPLKVTLFYRSCVCPGLFQRESNGGKLILPIWHDITKQEVHDFSPVLAGKMAMNTAIMTAHEIADNLVKLVDESK